jgi:hypothetical protein
MEKTVQELIVEALEEARILECALDEYDEDHVLYVAQCLSGAPYSFVEKIHSQSKNMQISC